MLKVNPRGKNSIRYHKYAKTEDHFELNLYFNSRHPQHRYSAQRKMQNLRITNEEIHAFEDLIFVKLSSLVLASEWTTNRNKFIVKSIDFDRFMTSDGSYTLILPSTSKVGQSVAQNRQNIFLFAFN